MRKETGNFSVSFSRERIDHLWRRSNILDEESNAFRVAIALLASGRKIQLRAIEGDHITEGKQELRYVLGAGIDMGERHQPDFDYSHEIIERVVGQIIGDGEL